MGLTADETPMAWLPAFGASLVSVVALFLAVNGHTADANESWAASLPSRFSHLLESDSKRDPALEGASAQQFDCLVLAVVDYGLVSDDYTPFGVAIHCDGTAELDTRSADGLDVRYRGRVATHLLAELDQAVAQARLAELPRVVEHLNGCGGLCYIAVRTAEGVRVSVANDPPRDPAFAELVRRVDRLRASVDWSKQ